MTTESQGAKPSASESGLEQTQESARQQLASSVQKGYLEDFVSRKRRFVQGGILDAEGANAAVKEAALGRLQDLVRKFGCGDYFIVGRNILTKEGVLTVEEANAGVKEAALANMQTQFDGNYRDAFIVRRIGAVQAGVLTEEEIRARFADYGVNN